MHYWNGFSQSFSLNKHLLLSGISFFVGGRNINRRKPGGDWRWIKHGSMTKMKYFAFGKGEPDGAEQSPQDCFCFMQETGTNFTTAHVEKGLADIFVKYENQ